MCVPEKIINVVTKMKTETTLHYIKLISHAL